MKRIKFYDNPDKICPLRDGEGRVRTYFPQEPDEGIFAIKMDLLDGYEANYPEDYYGLAIDDDTCWEVGIPNKKRLLEQLYNIKKWEKSPIKK